MPGFAITGELSSSPTGSTWAAVRTIDGRPLAVKIVAVSDVADAQARTAELRAVLRRIGNEHVVRLDGAIPLADGMMALVLDQPSGGSLSELLGARGQLTTGETVTTVAPLLGALAELHAVGVVHGDLEPRSVLFSADGRPMISELGVARLMSHLAGAGDRTSGFAAPEVRAGGVASPASDVYSMAAIGWFCLTGATPPDEATRPSLPSLGPRTPDRLVDVLTSCLSGDPAARPAARVAAVQMFDAAPAESVVLTSVPDPAAEITRRIRASAAPAPVNSVLPTTARVRRRLIIGVVALLVAAVVASGATWFFTRSTGAAQPLARSLSTRSASSQGTPSLAGPSPSGSSRSTWLTVTAPARSTAVTPTSPAAAAPARRSITDVVTAPDSPRQAAAGLLQALVDARALAYVARNPALLDLVYSPGAAKAVVDRTNIDIALKNGATYIGLAFVARDVAFLSGTSDTARIRATIVTPRYETGQPDGRRVPHAREILASSVFTLRLTPDGWRILGLTAV